MSLKLDAVPTGRNFDGWLVISERRQQKGHQRETVPDIPPGQDVPF